ncbi:MAG: thioredoxin domain-containing protein [Planctomycetes bacterium]|nr:thioredoxin domain-containing protein [Planctomycetota bacterium]
MRTRIAGFVLPFLALAAGGCGLTREGASAHRNRLVGEKSPYLLQHVGNPVDWHPWGDEAFERARREDKPVFLSIGYATCHWCHVMERESFEDVEVAAVLNERFVSVKVDREERPDVDHIYMSVCLSMNGQGGWPLTIVMTPDGKPFFAGTYFPKHALHGRPGLIDLLQQIDRVWREDRARVLASSEEIARFVREQAERAGDAVREPDPGALEAAFRQYEAGFDARRGGFGNAPKFPSPHILSFLLRWGRRSGDGRATSMAEATLSAMASGGIHDHLGGGFHRYSTDAEWLVPHFEKMLYDQAMLAIAYAEVFQATGGEGHAAAVRDILGYVLRDMTSPEGAFFCAEDADSEGLEGKFYVWRPEEILSVLGPQDGALFCRFYDVTDGGNFHEPHAPQGHSILHAQRGIEAFSRAEVLDPALVASRLAAGRGRLFAVRERRVHPGKDDKILTDWNGLTIAALAKCAVALDEPRYAASASRAADFLLSRMQTPQGRLLHRFRDGDAAIPGNLDDHAFLVWGLLELYGATFDPRWLAEALRINADMLRLFRGEPGILYFTGTDAQGLIARTRETYDGAHPSGNSVAALNLLRLARLTADAALETEGRAVLAASASDLERSATGHTQMLVAFDFALGPSREIVIAGDPSRSDTQALLRVARSVWRPNDVLLLRPPGEAGDLLARLAPFTAGQGPIGGKAAAYVCENYACQAPVADPAELGRMLGP